jgi:hypothetical protein
LTDWVQNVPSPGIFLTVLAGTEKQSYQFFYLFIEDHWGDQGVDGRIILEWIFRKWDVGIWTGLGWLRIDIGGGHL